MIISKAVNKSISYFLAVLFLAGLFHACVEPIHPYSGLAPGTWRAVLTLDGNKVLQPTADDRLEKGMSLFDENSADVLPFLFDVIYDSDSIFHIEIRNGDERIIERSIQMGRNPKDAKDTIRIDFELYDSHIIAIAQEDVMQGYWIVDSKENYRIPFKAFHSMPQRFFMQEKYELPAHLNVDGQWEVHFSPDSEDTYPAIAEFKQNGKFVEGTFRTETGDYRYLSGVIDADKLWLSVFDGAHAFLFQAKMDKNGELIGFFKSGKHYQTTWTGKRNPDFKLLSTDSLSKMTNEKVEFDFPNQDGKLVHFPLESDLGKINILQIMGTWCPNCRDETNFLIDYAKKNPNLSLDIKALAFERQKTEAKALKHLRNYKEKLGIPYPILLASLTTNKQKAVEVLPMIDKIISYPTMIILDKENKVRKIHTGFNGPATSEFAAFEKEFDLFIKQLAAE